MIERVPRVWLRASAGALLASFSLVASSADGQGDPPAPTSEPPAPAPSAPSEPLAPPASAASGAIPAPPPHPYPQAPPASYPPWPSQAQPYGPMPGPYGPSQVSLDLTTKTPGAGFEVYQEQSKVGRDAPIATCPSNCRLFLYPGKYRIRITETDETLSGNRLIDVSRSMAIDFDPDTSAKRTAGLVLGITGPIAMLAGVATLLGHPSDYEEEADRTRIHVGGFLLLGGLAATPIGWVMFGTSFKPEYEIRTWNAGPSPSWSMGPGVTGSGVGWVGSGSF